MTVPRYPFADVVSYDAAVEGWRYPDGRRVYFEVLLPSHARNNNRAGIRAAIKRVARRFPGWAAEVEELTRKQAWPRPARAHQQHT